MSTLALLAVRLPPRYMEMKVKRQRAALKAQLDSIYHPSDTADTPKAERRQARSAEYRCGSGRL